MSVSYKHQKRGAQTGVLPDPDVQVTVLDNGVSVVTQAVSGARSVAVGLLIDVGSRDEPGDVLGISHFVEHMVFRGTARRRAHHIAQRMEAVGGYLNAFTEKEVTCFYGRALPEHAGRAIDAVVDLALRPSFPEAEVTREQQVVCEELKLYDDTPEEAVFDLYDEVMYGDHGLGQPILGTPDTVQRLTRDRLHAFVEAHYRPERMVVCVVGAANHRRVVQATARAFADRPAHTATAAAHERIPPSTLPESKHRRWARPLQQAHVAFGYRAYAMDAPERHALTLLHTALGAGMSSRLNRHIREATGACYAIYSFVNAYTDTGDLGVYAGIDSDRFDQILPRIRRELRWFAENPLSDRSLRQVKNQARGEWLLGLEALSNRMVYIGRHMLYHTHPPSATAAAAGLEAVTASAIQQVAQELIMQQPHVEVVLHPDS